MELFQFLGWLIGRLWFRSLYAERLSAAAARSREITEPDRKEWFQQVCRRFFGFLEEQCGFQSDPPRLHEPGFQNPYLVVYRGQSLTIVVEGLSHCTRTRMCVIDREGQCLDITGLVRSRDPKLGKVCSAAFGQLEQIPLYAEALRSCAADVLDGDLREVSRMETVRPGFSFEAFSDAGDMDYFLKCHAPRPGSALMKV